MKVGELDIIKLIRYAILIFKKTPKNRGFVICIYFDNYFGNSAGL